MSLPPDKVRENWLHFLSRDAEEFAYLYNQTQYLRYLKTKSESPAMALVKEQIYRESLQGLEFMLKKLVKRVDQYHLNNDIKNWDLSE